MCFTDAVRYNSVCVHLSSSGSNKALVGTVPSIQSMIDIRRPTERVHLGGIPRVREVDYCPGSERDEYGYLRTRVGESFPAMSVAFMAESGMCQSA